MWVNLRNGSDGSLLVGCILGTIQFGNMDEFNVAQQNIKNVTIWRNKIIGYINLGLSSTNNQIKQIIVSENIITNYLNYFSILAYGASDCIINNNFCIAGIAELKNSRIYNNVLRNIVGSLTECVIENNFIIGNISNNSYLCSNSSFKNNAFTTNFIFPVGSNTGSNNLMSQETIKTFAGTDLTLSKNLVIRSDSPCKNAGTDGTDIGIFGGSAPFKAGAVPFNPHIDKAIISAQTDKDGKLKVDIQVSVQTR